MTQLKNLVSKFSYWKRTIRLIWIAAPRWTVTWTVLLGLQGTLPLATVYLTKLLIDSLVDAVNGGGGWEHLRPTFFLILLSAGVLFLGDVLQSITELVRTAQSELIQDYVKGLVHQQSAIIDISSHESSEYQDRLDRARHEAASRPLALLESTGSLLQNSITLIAMAVVLIPFSAWLPLVLVVSTLPAFYVVLRFDQRYHQWWQRRTAERRWSQYYDLLLTHSVVAPELRLFALSRHFRSGYANLRGMLRDERFKELKKQSLGKLGAGALAPVATGATLFWMLLRATQVGFTLGDLALFYQAFVRGQGLMRSLLGNVGQIYSNSLFLENLYTFLDMKPSVSDPTRPLNAPSVIKDGIRFRNVSFAYPGAKAEALRNFNLFIPAGKVVAIVGANGAGKTTLLKLLCRFYDPTSGRVELDGVDIRSFKLEELRRTLTVQFQFPVNYQATALQSIAMGDLAAEPTILEVEAAARNAGAHDFISRLRQGYDTQLGSTFGNGVELSGGEWHRVATARAYMRQSPIILLDEPTSMMDSWAESEWFGRFRAVAKDRTAIVITHRFSIAMRADVIHVMQDGEIVESGTHRELVAQDGTYAKSWAAQLEAEASSDHDNISHPADLHQPIFDLQEVEA